MSNFPIDYSRLENKIYKKAYKLQDVQHQIERVAFDVVKFKDSDKGADLWQIQNSDDGDYIVALYSPDEEKVAENWSVAVVKTAGEIQISYKGDPLVKISSRTLGIPAGELGKVQDYLPAKLSENKKLVKALLNELSESAKNQVFNKYPELVV